MKPYKVGTKVQWKWLGKAILGHIEQVYLEKVTQTIKNKKIVRNGTPENPAYLVKSDAGNLALKLGSELTASPKTAAKSTSAKPKIFS